MPSSSVCRARMASISHALSLKHGLSLWCPQLASLNQISEPSCVASARFHRRFTVSASSFANENREFVIVGGGNAAGYAARTFVEHGMADGKLCIVSKEAHAPYERPALTKGYLFPLDKKPARLPGFHTCVGSGGERQTPEWYNEKGIEMLYEDPVTNIDTDKQTLRTDSGKLLKYGTLIIATGCTASRFPDTIGGNLPGVHYIRDVADANSLISSLEKAKKVVVVGGGYIGMEVAAAAVGWKLDTTIIFPEDHLMTRLFTPSLGQKYEELYQDYGVKFLKLLRLPVKHMIGREEEIVERVIRVLLKRRKSNVCLVGDLGVGRSAIVEALAMRIAEASVPSKLIGNKVFSIDVGGLVGGQLKERLRNLVDSKGGVIVFIDELHILIKDGDANSILKLALARGDLKCIGGTTLKGYRKYMAALNHAFECIQTPEAARDDDEWIAECIPFVEPSREEAIAMLEGLKLKYELHHRAIYTQPALIHAVDLSTRYIRELALPDKAIDLIDEAGARAHILGLTFVTKVEIEHVVSARTGIPLDQLSALESPHLLERSHVIGQGDPVVLVTRRRPRFRIKDETKPSKPVPCNSNHTGKLKHL